jgi:flagellar M-ring protein FliF
MDQLRKLYASLTLKQRISVLLAAVVAIGSLVSLSRWNKERDFTPLYTGLSQEDAAAVLAKVRESGSEFRLSENGSSVLAPSARAAELRLQLAAAGIPKSGRIGFELFDRNNFGSSDFTEQINYHRALEGELERSVMALAEVEQARVHLTFAKESLFLDSRQPAKASVLVKLRPGAHLSPQNVAAICQLTSSAVEGLAAESVSVVDMRGNLLSRPRRQGSPDSPEPDEAMLDYRQKIERDLLAKIAGTLEPVVGPDKFRAGVSVECDFSSGEQSEESFDPSKSVMVSSQKTEDISGTNSASGVPGTASNLPRPTSRPGAGGSSTTRRTESVAYQSSRTVRRTRLPQGTVKRLSVSILLDQNPVKGKRPPEPPSPEKLKSIRELVAGAIGFSTERGDQLVIESLPFELAPVAEPMPAAPPAPVTGLPPWLEKALKNRTAVLIGAGAALLLVAVLGFAVLRSRKRKQSVAVQPQLPAGSSSAEFAQQVEAQLAEQAALKHRQETEALNALKMPAVTTKKAEILSKHIAEEAKKDSVVMAQVLRTWINETGT